MAKDEERAERQLGSMQRQLNRGCWRRRQLDEITNCPSSNQRGKSSKFEFTRQNGKPINTTRFRSQTKPPINRPKVSTFISHLYIPLHSQLKFKPRLIITHLGSLYLLPLFFLVALFRLLCILCYPVFESGDVVLCDRSVLGLDPSEEFTCIRKQGRPTK